MINIKPQIDLNKFIGKNQRVRQVLPRDFWFQTDQYSRLELLSEDDSTMNVFKLINDLRTLIPVTVATIFTDIYRLIQDHALITVTEDVAENIEFVTVSGGEKPETNGARYAENAGVIGSRPGYEDGTLLRVNGNQFLIRVGNDENADTLSITGFTVTKVEYIRRITIPLLVEAQSAPLPNKKSGERIYSDEKIILAHVLDTFLRDDVVIRKIAVDDQTELRSKTMYKVRLRECREFFGDNLVVEVLSDKLLHDLWLQ